MAISSGGGCAKHEMEVGEMRSYMLVDMLFYASAIRDMAAV